MIDDSYEMNKEYQFYLYETQTLRKNIIVNVSNNKDLIAVPVYRINEQGRPLDIDENGKYFSEFDARVKPKHLLIYSAPVNNLNNDSALCAKRIFGSIYLIVETDDVPGFKDGQVLRYWEDITAYQKGVSMLPIEKRKNVLLIQHFDSPVDRYMRQNYMSSFELIPGKITMTETASFGLKKKMETTDEFFKGYLYESDGSLVPVNNNGSTAKFFKDIKEDKIGRVIDKGTQ